MCIIVEQKVKLINSVILCAYVLSGISEIIWFDLWIGVYFSIIEFCIVEAWLNYS